MESQWCDFRAPLLQGGVQRTPVPGGSHLAQRVGWVRLRPYTALHFPKTFLRESCSRGAGWVLCCAVSCGYRMHSKARRSARTVGMWGQGQELATGRNGACGLGVRAPLDQILECAMQAISPGEGPEPAKVKDHCCRQPTACTQLPFGGFGTPPSPPPLPCGWQAAHLARPPPCFHSRVPSLLLYPASLPPHSQGC